MTNHDNPNAFELLAQAKANMELAWLSKEQVKQHFCELFDKATAGDYDNLVMLCAEWLDVDAIRDDLKIQ